MTGPPSSPPCTGLGGSSELAALFGAGLLSAVCLVRAMFSHFLEGFAMGLVLFFPVGIGTVNK